MMILLSLMISASAPATTAMPLSRTELTKVLRSRCARVPNELTDADALPYIQAMASRQLHFRSLCSRDVRLAVRAASSLADAPSGSSGAAHLLLAGIYEDNGLGRDPDRGLARHHRALAWLLGAIDQTDFVFSGVIERDSFLAKADTIAFLEERAANSQLTHLRAQLARALLARRAPGDLEQTRALLQSVPVPPSRVGRLLLAEALLIADGTPERVERASVVLRSSSSWPFQSDTRDLLLAIGRRQLMSGQTPEDRWRAIETLAAAAIGGEPERVAELLQAVNSANGDRPAAASSATIPTLQLTGEDYPARALREEMQGTVRLRGLVDPRGRLIFSEASKPGQEPVLVDAARRAFARRQLSDIQVNSPRPTPYVWTDLPSIAFVIGN